MEITRHFTATTFVVREGKTLLHRHRKLQMWLPPGGHIDRDELPEEAAVREVKEETGLDVELYRPDKQDLKFEHSHFTHRPQHILLETINEFHQHIDFIYYAKAETFAVRSAEGETDELIWVSPDEIKGLGAWDDVCELAKEAIKLLS